MHNSTGKVAPELDTTLRAVMALGTRSTENGADFAAGFASLSLRAAEVRNELRNVSQDRPLELLSMLNIKSLSYSPDG